MKIMKCIVCVGACLIVGYTGLFAFQYMTDRDRKEIDELKKIQPSREAIELELVRSFPTDDEKTAGPYFAIAFRMAMDSNGIIYITDQRTDAIYKIDSSGKYLGQIGTSGQGPGDLSMPMKIKIVNDEIIVQEAGNMRLQYFDMQGNHKKATRLFKSYHDLDILQDGRIIGTLLHVEPHQSDVLIDVLSSEGMKIRSFGIPIEFKYDRSSLNARMIFINSKNEIIQIFQKLALIQLYSLQGHLIQEKRLETEFSYIKEKINRRMNSYRPKKRVGYLTVFRRASVLEDHVFIVDSVPPRIWIWEVDEKIEITRRYWADVGSYFYVRDMMTVKENNKIKFYLLGDIGEDVTKIHVFAKK